jgi:hypothetical protein
MDTAYMTEDWQSTVIYEDVAAVTGSITLPAFSSVTAEAVNLNVTLTAADYYGIDIESGGRAIVYEFDGDELIIRDLTETEYDNGFSLNMDIAALFDNYENGYIKIYCPASALNSAEIDNTSGAIRINGVNIVDLSAESVSGDIDIINCDADLIECETSSGRIQIDDSFAADIDLYTVSGRINMMKSRAEELRCETASGRIHIEDSFAEDISLETVSGQIKCALDAASSDFYTKLSTVTGTTRLNGDKNAKGGYENNGGRDTDFSLYAETVSGSIDISFNK